MRHADATPGTEGRFEHRRDRTTRLTPNVPEPILTSAVGSSEPITCVQFEQMRGQAFCFNQER